MCGCSVCYVVLAPLLLLVHIFRPGAPAGLATGRAEKREDPCVRALHAEKRAGMGSSVDPRRRVAGRTEER
jgi:hypothetical protein